MLTANMPPARRPIRPFCPGSKARMSTNTQKAQTMGRKSCRANCPDTEYRVEMPLMATNRATAATIQVSRWRSCCMQPSRARAVTTRASRAGILMALMVVRAVNRNRTSPGRKKAAGWNRSAAAAELGLFLDMALPPVFSLIFLG